MNKFLTCSFLFSQWALPTHYAVFSDSYKLTANRKIAQGDHQKLNWYRLEYKKLAYDNYKECGLPKNDYCTQPIKYFWTKIPVLKGKSEINIKDFPKIFSPGTHRLHAAADFPKVDPKPKNAIEIVIRRNNSYVGFVSELLGLPFVFWPRKTSLGYHQTDYRLGADCVATLVYGQRRIGHKVPYVAPQGLFKYIQPIMPIGDTQPIKLGDILHFGHQTAVISQDKEPIGYLNGTDMVIHAYPNVVREDQIKDLPYRFLAYRVYRWKRELNVID